MTYYLQTLIDAKVIYNTYDLEPLSPSQCFGNCELEGQGVWNCQSNQFCTFNYAFNCKVGSS
jgi:hypothetical protein